MHRVLGVTPDLDPLAHLGACLGDTWFGSRALAANLGR
jgi:hypothetical protein